MNGREWTQDDTLTVQRMAKGGYTDAEIAEHMGRRRCFICQKRRDINQKPGQSPAQTAALRRMRARARARYAPA